MNNHIWTNILLKTVEGSSFTNATTITDTRKKYQIFEVLVAETLAHVQPELNWQVTVGASDGGIDFIASALFQYKTPFQSKEIEQIILGQIKRRSNGYRYDDFRTDISTAFEYYTSSYASKGKSLLELLFVISTDNKTNIQNLEADLKKEILEKRRLTFVANLRSPIHIIDANDIIKYWKYNFSFVQRLISSFVSPKDLKDFKKYLGEIVEDEYVQVNVTEIANANIGEIVEVPICIQTSTHGLPSHLTIYWNVSDEIKRKLQLIKPLELLKKGSGLCIEITAEYHLSIFFRALSEGEFSLGSLNITTGEGHLVGNFRLGTMQFSKNLMPVFQHHPNNDISEKLYLNLIDETLKYQCSTVLGCGGIGKSFLINELMIRLSNQNYLCIKMEHSHSVVAAGDFMREFVCELIGSQLHKVYLISELKKYLIHFLNEYYIEEWTDDIDKFFSTCENFNLNTISSLIVTLIIKISMKQTLIVWFSNLHWLNETDSNIILKISQMLDRNQNFLPFHVRFILEGRKDEIIVQNNKKVFIPHIWQNLQLKIRSVEYTLKFWNKDDTEKFIASLLDLRERKQDHQLYVNLYDQLLAMASGVPMHIIEQIRYLLQQSKLCLGQKGRIIISDSKWEGLFSSKLKELVYSRLLYFIKQYPEYGNWLILYAKFDNISSKALKHYICKCIQNSNPLAEVIALKSDFFKFANSTIKFQHEYYEETMKSMSVQGDQAIHTLLKWCDNQEVLSLGDQLCKIKLLNLLDIPDYASIIKNALIIIRENIDDSILFLTYLILVDVPEILLHQFNLELCSIYNSLSHLTMRLGNYETAEEYLNNILRSDISENSHVYYCAWAYQQLSNINSAKLKLDIAIDYVKKGLQYIQNQENSDSLSQKLMETQIMLFSRQSINYAFAGDWDYAMHYQKIAVLELLKIRNPYIMIRIAYERCGLLLHQSPQIQIQRLAFLYQQASKIPEMFPTELYLIKAMELVGRLVLNYDKSTEINNINKDAINLEQLLKNQNSNYIACINYLVLGTCNLLSNNVVDEALSYFFKATENALDSGRDEMLWKCYINISQLYHHVGLLEEAQNYAQKSFMIMNKLLQNNPRQKANLLKLYQNPLYIADSILNAKELSLYYLDNSYVLETLAVKWNNETIFLMK